MIMIVTESWPSTGVAVNRSLVQSMALQRHRGDIVQPHAPLNGGRSATSWAWAPGGGEMLQPSLK
jgi:hypothetical protein